MAQRLSIIGTRFRSSVRQSAMIVLMGGMLCLALPGPAGAASYQAGLVRMAEILGSIHHLRSICTLNEGSMWRGKMIDMLGMIEGPKSQRDVLISHFNDYYFRAERRFPVCTSAAAIEANRLFREAESLARRLEAQSQSR
ncbi:MAG: TIGR02301 family protein [Rhizobiales bacterium]|nr:TIGR02301 family protein [Hyphomicrobiales bacterium]